VDVLPEVMIPLVGDKKELDHQAKIVRDVAAAVFEEQGRKVKHAVGTMIEVPRGALTADRIAETAEFFSFGTNDLTQTTFGVSRDDVGVMLQTYLARDIYEVDPFVSIDRDGVGELMRIAAERGRRTRPNIKLGICGEHGGDPKSVAFCHELGLEYVSCSPYRLPIARLAAAQAVLREEAAARPAPKAERARPVRLANGKQPSRKQVRNGRKVARPVAVAAAPKGRKKGRAARLRARA
jgi:pyruvate,orthophosphate dikinase